MGGYDPDRPSLFLRPNPDCSRTANQRKRIIPDDFCRPFDLQFDRVVCEWPNGVKFICYSQHDARRIRPVRDQAGVVGQKRKPHIDALPGVILGDDQLALNVALKSQVAPFVKEFTQFDNEWRVAKVRELFPVGVSFCNQFTANVHLEVIAIGTDNRFRESNGSVAASPMEGRLEHDFFVRIALRLVETRCWLRFPEYVRNSVITDAIPGPEIAVRVVVEGAPAD